MVKKQKLISLTLLLILVAMLVAGTLLVSGCWVGRLSLEGKMVYSAADYPKISIMEASGREQTRLTETVPWRTLYTQSRGGTHPHWSPGGDRIVFTAYIKPREYRLIIMNADGSDVFELSKDVTETATPEWSPDGSQIIFVDQEGYLTLINPDGTGFVRLTEGNWPSWSPDGSRIVYSGHVTGNHKPQLFTMNRDGTAQTQITQDGLYCIEPDWSPNGEKIVFSAVTTSMGPSAIYLINPDGTQQTQITSQADDDSSPCWSPDGSMIAFSTYRDKSDSEIFVMLADGNKQTRITNNMWDDMYPDWTNHSAD